MRQRTARPRRRGRKDDAINMEKLTYGLQQVAVKKFVSDYYIVNATLESWSDPIIQGLQLELKSYFLRSPHPAQKITIHAPADWWQHFKERWFPNWLEQKFPVRYGIPTPYEFGPVYICPHADIKFRDHQEVHFSWLNQNFADPLKP